MRLNAKVLKNVIDVNHFQWVGQAYIQEGNSNDLYIQLVNLDWSISETTYQPVGPFQSTSSVSTPNRYISQAAVISVSAYFDSIDDSEQFSIIGSQPFAGDKSIWKFSLTNVQTPSTGNLKITVTEDSVSKTFIIKQAISVQSLNQGGC